MVRSRIIRTHTRRTRQGPILGQKARTTERVARRFHASTASRTRSVRFLKLGVSKSAIAKITGVSRPTLYHFIGTRGLSLGP